MVVLYVSSTKGPITVDKDNFSLGTFKIGGGGEGKLIGKLFPIQNMRYACSSSYFSDYERFLSRI